MSTIREFVATTLGRKVANNRIEWWKHGNKDYQCVELIYFYLKEVFWKSRVFSLWDWKNNHISLVKNYWFEKQKNTKDFIAKRWDIVSFWATPDNIHWHVAIVLFADINFMYVLEQNAWTWGQEGEWRDAVTIRKKSYSNVTGIVRYKNIDEIVSKSFYDKVVFDNNESIFFETKETRVKRRAAAKWLYYAFTGTFDGWEQIWVSKNLDDPIIRQDFAHVLMWSLNNVRWMKVTLDDLKNKYNIWSGVRPWDQLTPFEFDVMLNNMVKKFK